MRMPTKGGPSVRRWPSRELPRGAARDLVFFVEWPRAEAVLEVDAKVLHGLALELRAHAIVDRRGEPRGGLLFAERRRVPLERGLEVARVLSPEVGLRNEADAERELHGVACPFVHGAERHRAEAAGRVGLVEMGAAVDRVDRLPRSRFAGIVQGGRAIGQPQDVHLLCGFVEDGHARWPSAAPVRRVSERTEEEWDVVVLVRACDVEHDVDLRIEHRQPGGREVRAGLEGDPVGPRLEPSPLENVGDAPVVVGRGVRQTSSTRRLLRFGRGGRARPSRAGPTTCRGRAR